MKKSLITLLWIFSLFVVSFGTFYSINYFTKSNTNEEIVEDNSLLRNNLKDHIEIGYAFIETATDANINDAIKLNNILKEARIIKEKQESTNIQIKAATAKVIAAIKEFINIQ